MNQEGGLGLMSVQKMDKMDAVAAKYQTQAQIYESVLFFSHWGFH